VSGLVSLDRILENLVDLVNLSVGYCKIHGCSNAHTCVGDSAVNYSSVERRLL